MSSKQYTRLEQYKDAYNNKNARRLVFERDDWTCQWCKLFFGTGNMTRRVSKKKQVYLEIDHVDKNRKNNVPGNLRCLCNTCNARFNLVVSQSCKTSLNNLLKTKDLYLNKQGTF